MLYKRVALKIHFLFGNAATANLSEKIKAAATVRAFGSDLFGMGYRAVKDDQTQVLASKLTALQQYDFYSRYGDCLVTFCLRLKTRSHVEKTLNHERLSSWNNFWTDISLAIDKE